MDGVLACFEAAYAPLITEETGIIFPRLGDEDWPDEWYWDRSSGMTKEQEKRVWGRIAADENFWATLPPTRFCKDTLQYAEELRRDGHYVCFITTRPGSGAQAATEYWLQELQGFVNPNVFVELTPQDKAKRVKELNLDIFIDDKPENCVEVAENSTAAVFLMDQPWNRKWDNDKDAILRAYHPVDALKWAERREALGQIN